MSTGTTMGTRFDRDTGTGTTPTRPGPGARLVAALAGWATGTGPPRIFTVLGGHRRLFRAWLPFSTWLLFGTDLPRRDVELLVLRTAHNCAATYEWAQHVPLALRAGLHPDDVRRLTAGSSTTGWDARSRALLRAADDLHSHQVITDTAWADATTVLSPREILEVCFVVGQYEMLAMTLNSVDVRPEPGTLAALGAADADVVADLRRTLLGRRRERSGTDGAPPASPGRP